LDREAGAILRTLEQAGQLDNTLVVFTSDNGMPFPRAKANLYDAGTHVPLAIRFPGKARAGRGATTSSPSPILRQPCSKQPGSRRCRQ
jgi:N-sulfoglucosamine sulfohydrolase